MKSLQLEIAPLVTIGTILLMSASLAQGQPQFPSPIRPQQSAIQPLSAHDQAGIRAALGGSFYFKPSPDVIARGNRFQETIDKGTAALNAGDVDGAIVAFQQAHDIEPDDGQVLERLAEAYTAKGQPDQALAFYRALFYHVPGQRWTSSEETNPTVLMKFALTLLKTGHEQEALTAYHQALRFLNYDNGKPNQDVPIPELGPAGTPYTPQLLEAMAHLAIGMNTPGFDSGELRKAVKLAPASAEANFYLGKYLYGHNDPAAKTALEKAVQLGDDQTAAAAKEILKFIR